MPTLDAKTRATLEALLTDALLMEGIELGEDGAPTTGAQRLQQAAPAVLAHLVNALDEGEPEVLEPEASEEERDEPVEDALRANLESALGKYVQVSEDGQENIQIDADFMKERGGQLIGDMFKAFAATIVPTELTVNVPGGTKESPRTVRLDFSALFSGLQSVGEE